MRRRHVIGIARFADAQQQHGVAVDSVGGNALEQREGRGLTDGDAVARDVERAAGSPARRAAASESRTAWSGTASPTPPTTAASIRSGLDHAPRRAEHLGARRAGRGHGHCRDPPSRSAAARSRRPRRSCALRRSRNSPAARRVARIAPAVGQFGLQDAGGARADEHADPRRAPNGRAASCTASKEAVLPQGQLRQAVVAAIEYAAERGQAAARRRRRPRRCRFRGRTVSKSQSLSPLRCSISDRAFARARARCSWSP